jgi:hypothetical protein
MGGAVAVLALVVGLSTSGGPLGTAEGGADYTQRVSRPACSGAVAASVRPEPPPTPGEALSFDARALVRWPAFLTVSLVAAALLVYLASRPALGALPQAFDDV